MKNILGFFRRHKKASIISLGATVGICLVAYGVWSTAAWSSYANHYKSAQNIARSSLDKVFQSKSNIDQLAAVKKTAQDFRGNESACDISPLLSWQSNIISTLHTQKVLCEQAVSRLSALKGSVGELTLYLESEQTLITILSTSELKKTEITESDFTGQVTSWQTAMDGAKNMATSDSFKSVKDKSIDSLGHIVETWKSIKSAHEAKDEVKYAEAVAKVPIAYQALSEIGDQNKKQYQTLLDNLQGMYKEIFK